MESFHFEDNLFIPIVVFDFPSPEVQIDDFLFREFCLIVQVSQKDRYRAIRTYQFDDPDLEGFKLLSLLYGYFAQVFAAWNDPNLVFLLTAFDEFFDSREAVLCRATKDKISLKCIYKIGDELITGVTSVEKQDTADWNKW